MINSRDLKELSPIVREKVELFLSKCHAVGIDLLVTSTYRDYESQQALFEQGRSTSGKIVTNAQAGYSFHNFRCAVDVVPLRLGKPVWDSSDPLWKVVGQMGEDCGLEWAGRWQKFKETAHFQYTEGRSLAELRALKEKETTTATSK